MTAFEYFTLGAVAFIPLGLVYWGLGCLIDRINRRDKEKP